MTDREALNVYATHPYHVKVASEWVKPYVQDLMVLVTVRGHLIHVQRYDSRSDLKDIPFTVF